MSKTIQNIIVFILFTIYSSGVFAETVISGSISGDAVWVKDSGGYIVDGVCIQDPKSTLKISPGVSIRFNTGSVLILNGLVNAEGSDVDPIIIKGAQDDRFKIQLNSAADNSVLSWIEIRGGGDGFEGALVIKTGSPKVMNIKIINAKAFGFYAEKCNSSISNLLVERCSNGAFIDGRYIVSKSIFRYNSGVGVSTPWYGPGTLSESLVYNNSGDGVAGPVNVFKSQIFNNGGKGVIVDGNRVELSDNYVGSNKGGGIYLYDDGSLATRNVIQGNSGGAAFSGKDCCMGRMAGNLIIDNDSGNQAVLNLKNYGGVKSIDHNSIIRNQGFTLVGLYKGCCDGLLSFTENNILQNNANIFLETSYPSSVAIDAGNNWWGNDNILDVGKKTRDASVNANLASISLTPAQSGVVGKTPLIPPIELHLAIVDGKVILERTDNHQISSVYNIYEKMGDFFSKNDFKLLNSFNFSNGVPVFKFEYGKRYYATRLVDVKDIPESFDLLRESWPIEINLEPSVTGESLVVANSIIQFPSEIRGGGAIFGDSALIVITNRFSESFVFYTLDGSQPTLDSLQYSGSFIVKKSAVIRVFTLSPDFALQSYSSPVAVQIVPTFKLFTESQGSGKIAYSGLTNRFLQDEVLGVKAIPNDGWRFARWEGDLSGSFSDRNVAMSRDKIVRAVFEAIPKYVLSTVANGGSLTGGGSYYQGTSVNLQAIPATGWNFLGWSGDYVGNEPGFSWAVESPASFVANFGTTISNVATGSGQIVLEPALAVYPYGTEVRVIPVPNPGFALALWGGVGTGQPKREWILKVTTATPRVTALFQALSTDKAVLTAQSTLGGRVTQSAVDGIYTKSTSVVLTPVADVGYEFTSWSGDASGSENPLTVVLDSSKSVKAGFRKVGVASYPVTVAVTGPGTVRRIPDLGAYEAGSEVEIVAEPVGGGLFAGWTGAVTSSQRRVRVTVNGAVSVGANFKSVYPVATEVRGEGQVLLSPPEASYPEGTSVALTAKAADGWGFVQWSGDIVTTTQEAGVMVDGPKRVIAEFARLGTLTTKVVGSGSITRTPAGQSFLPGTAVTLTAQAQAGWRFLRWSGAASGSNATTSVVVGRTEAIVAEFTDGEAPVLSVTQPVSGTVVDPRFNLAGAASDGVSLRDVTWTWNGVTQGMLNLTDSGFSVADLNLQMGTNLIEVLASDKAGNEAWVRREVIWSPIRKLVAGSAAEVQEGQRMSFPLALVSTGDVAGLTFKLNYNPAFLTDPKVEWSAAVGQSVNSLNFSLAGEISGAFSLAGQALSAGTVAVGTVSFRARSVPAGTNVVLSPVIVSAGNASGGALTSGNGTIAGEGRIRPRRIKGDNNANQRIDIGDATVISRLQVGLEEMRAWDVGLNDLNGTSTLDNGDVIKALRIVVGMDVQPGPMGDAKRLPGTVAMELTPMSTHYSAELALLDGPTIQIGRPYRVAVTLKAGQGDLTGLSFSLRYPASLELKEKAISAGVPTDALPAWNVSGNRAKLAVIRPKAWAAHSGTVAVFTFEAKPEASQQMTLPIRLEDLEVADVGEGLSAIPSVWLEIGGGLTAAPELRLRRVEGEALSLEVVGGEGLPMVLEGSVDMTAWTETQRLTGQGTGTPVKVTLQPDPNVQTKFWRVRVR